MQFKKKELSLLICSCLAASTPTFAESESSVELDSLIISAKAPVDETSFSGSVTVVTAEEIAASGATNINDVLATTPSVQMVKTGQNPSPAPQLRGLDPEQTLILVNGKRIPNTDRTVPQEPAFRYGLVPLANIERIEIIRGPASSLYGADALAGVINIITKEATLDWTGSISLYSEKMENANGGDGQGMSLSASGALGENADLLISGETSSTDGILDDDNSDSLQTSRDVDNYQVDLGIDLDSGDRLEFGILSSDEESIEFSSGVEDDSAYVTNQIFTVEYFTEISGFDTSISAVAGESDVLEDTRVWSVNESDLSVDSQGRLDDKNYLSFGANYREEAAERGDTTVFEDEIDATTVFFQDVYEVTERTTLTFGLAYDSHSKYGSESSPKLNVVTQITPEIGFKAGYGESYLAPSLSQGSSSYVVSAGPTRQYSGNDDLKPETAKTAEVGLTFQKPNSSGSVTLFHSNVDDLIDTTSSTSGSVTTYEYNNVDSSILQGLELSWSFFNDAGSKKLNLSYTFLDTEDESTGKELTERSKHLAKANYFHKNAFSGFDMDAAARYTGTQFTDSDNTETIGAYFVADLGVSKEVLAGTTVRFGINNLTDEVVLNDSDQLLEAGRSYKLSLTSSF
ncbi:TonB-dependent receptor [Marinomonas sp. C2222]|uniref:TonB-dependent receptor n=1 Tax=Marinomonas sargassi TaxID=2984494 RepID=A0ABT2YU14_9GAMM|nr:TonB-dependent receptor [Marinomonas sargassi]MCV2403388.1 TonB-dependent receptor [Marinomonas sargassi]